MNRGFIKAKIKVISVGFDYSPIYIYIFHGRSTRRAHCFLALSKLRLSRFVYIYIIYKRRESDCFFVVVFVRKSKDV